MLFSAIAIALALLPVCFGAAVQRRGEIDPQTCVGFYKYIGVYHGTYSPACANLVNNCLNNNATLTDPWGQSTCVAAATCGGTNSLLTLIQCKDSSFEPSSAPNLNYNVYASMVGDCAWQEGGCPITFQNYVDFVYGQLSAIGSTEWPSDVEFVRTYWWNYIVDWAKTGETVPYLNFNDWLRYSNA